MNAVYIIFIIWIGIGAIMVLKSQSRGWWADTLFVVTWPVHFIMYLLGKD